VLEIIEEFGRAVPGDGCYVGVMRVRAWPAVVGVVLCLGAGPVDLSLAKSGEVVVLGAGSRAGGDVVPAGVTVTSDAKAEFVSASGPGLVLSDGVTLRGLVVRGDPAIVVPPGARVVLESVVALGSVNAIRIESGAVVTLRDVEASCSFSGVTKEGSERPVALYSTGATVSASGSRLGSGCARAVAVSGGAFTAVEGSFAARETGLRALDSELSLSGVSITVSDASSSAGLYVARSRSTLRRVTVRGGEHGLLVRAGRMDVDGFSSSGNLEAGVALVNGAAVLRGLRLTGPFGGAAVSASDAVSLEVVDSELARVGVRGIAALRTTLVVKHTSIAGARREGSGDLGHGVMAVESETTIEGLRVSDTEGTAVWVQRGSGRGKDIDVKSSAAAWVQLGSRAVLEALKVASDVRLGVLSGDGASVSVQSGRIESELGVMTCAGASSDLRPEVVSESRIPKLACGDADLSRPLPERRAR